MPTITNVITNPEGQNAKVTIKLIGVWTADGVSETLPTDIASVLSDSNGSWSATLLPQSAYEGTTYYEVREPSNVTHTFTVADTPSVQKLRDRLATPIPALNSTTLKLDDLSDVISTSPSPGQILTFNGTNWIPASAGSGISQISFILNAGATLSAHKVVTKSSDGTINYASNDNISHINSPLWITNNSAVLGAPVTVITYGDIEEPSWSWTPGPLYLELNGVITQTVPTATGGTLFLAQLGFATGPTSAFIDREPSIKLA